MIITKALLHIVAWFLIEKKTIISIYYKVVESFVMSKRILHIFYYDSFMITHDTII